MDAVNFLEERNRMCKSYGDCVECPIKEAFEDNERYSCNGWLMSHGEESVAIVEKWSAEHPISTRQSEFLKMFPDAQIMVNGAIQICPRRIEKSKMFSCRINCDDCRKEYWFAEVE